MYQVGKIIIKKDIQILNCTVINTLIFLLTLIIFIFSMIYVNRQSFFTLDSMKLKIIPSQELVYISSDEIYSIILDNIKGNFLTFNLKEIHRILNSRPLIRNVAIYRLWPNALQFFIEEHKPYAWWNMDKLINNFGEILSIDSNHIIFNEKLPFFFGPNGSEFTVLQNYIEFSKWIYPIGMTIKEIHLSKYHTWKIKLSNEMELELGHCIVIDNVLNLLNKDKSILENRIKRFVRIWPILFNKDNRIKEERVRSVDLRYTNGFSLTLKP